MNGMKEQLSELNKASKKSVALYHRFAYSVGVSDSALGVLYALLEGEGDRSQYELWEEWSIPRQTINTAVAALGRRGLVALTPVPGAKNKKSVALTASGREFAEKTVGRLREAELAALGTLTAEERETYVRLNGKYNRALAERLDEGDMDPC